MAKKLHGGTVDMTLHANALRDAFGKDISIYTKEQALADGVTFEAGMIGERCVVFTSNLISRFEKPALLTAAILGVAKGLSMPRPGATMILIGDEKVYVDFNGRDITIMLREDY